MLICRLPDLYPCSCAMVQEMDISNFVGVWTTTKPEYAFILFIQDFLGNNGFLTIQHLRQATPFLLSITSSLTSLACRPASAQRPTARREGALQSRRRFEFEERGRESSGDLFISWLQNPRRRNPNATVSSCVQMLRKRRTKKSKKIYGGGWR